MDYSYDSQAFQDATTFVYSQGDPNNDPDVLYWAQQGFPNISSPPIFNSHLIHGGQSERLLDFESSSLDPWATVPPDHREPGRYVALQGFPTFSDVSAARHGFPDSHEDHQIPRNSQYRSLIAPMAPPPPTGAPLFSSLSPRNSCGVRLGTRQPSSSLLKDLRVELFSADTIFQSTDAALFFVHEDIIQGASSNSFGSFLKLRSVPPKVIKVDIDSGVLNLIIFAIYSSVSAKRYVVDDYALPLPVSHESSFSALSFTVDTMGRYGLSPSDFIYSSSALFKELYRHAPFHPLDVYALAAHYDLRQLATATSAHLLSLDLRKISVAQSQRMGATYYQRLNLLHTNRLAQLKEILGGGPPSGHPFDLLCTNVSQRDMRSNWALAIIDVIRNATPALSPDYFKGQMRSFVESVDCVTCRNQCSAKIEDAAVQWSKVKHTI